MLKPPFPYQLRPLRPADVAGVMAIERLTNAAPWKEASFHYEVTENRLANYQALLVRQGDRPAQLIGYAGYWLIADEIHISAITVHPQWRGRGLGELLFLNLMFLASGEPAVLATLEVRRSNLSAQKLYAKYQYRLVGERRRYYKDNGEDALLMTIEPLNREYRAFLRQRRARLFARLATKLTK